jgi:hypothetical protein
MGRAAVVLGAVVLALAFTGAAASANATDPPPGGGSGDCKADGTVSLSGGTIYFHGYTSCAGLVSYRITTTYSRGGTTIGPTSDIPCLGGVDQQNCGLNGTNYNTPNISGTQSWCMHVRLFLAPTNDTNDFATCLSA